MVGAQIRRYLSLVIVVAIISTAWTTAAWIWRDRTLRLLAIQGPDFLFAAAQGEEIISVSVAPERKLGNLEFEFRCLIERDPATVPINITKVGSIQQLLEECLPVADRFEYFSALDAEPFISVHEVLPTNVEGHRLVMVDFGRVYASLFDPRYQNESLTTFAFLINSTDHLVGYFEGYSEYVVLRGAHGRLLKREELLNLVRVEEGGTRTDYVPDAGPDQLSIEDDLPAWGRISFRETARDKGHGVTLIVKEGKIGLERLLIIVETFADGRWLDEASGYWVVRTRRI